MRTLLLFCLLLAGSIGACGEAAPPSDMARTGGPPAAATQTGVPDRTYEADSLTVRAAVDAFHSALAAADTAAALDLLADDAVVLESGGFETRTEYASHHLAADMAFSAAVPGTREVLRVEVHDDVAWVIAVSRRQGTFRDREIDSRGAELIVLQRQPAGWRISAVHWSSRSGG